MTLQEYHTPYSSYYPVAAGDKNIECAIPWIYGPGILTLVVPRAGEIGYTQPCIIAGGKLATHFVYFWSRRTLPYTHLEAISYIPQQRQCLHIWTTSLSTIGCLKYKYTIQFVWMACISRFTTAILSGKTELTLGTIRVKRQGTRLRAGRPGFDPGWRRSEFFHYFFSRLVLESTQPPVKWVPGGKDGQAQG